MPTLATVIVGDDPASEIYVRNKHRACEEAGMSSAHHGLAAATGEAELLELVAALGADEEVDGILVQLPVPDHIDPDAVVAAIDPAQGRRRPHARSTPACSPTAPPAWCPARRPG